MKVTIDKLLLRFLSILISKNFPEIVNTRKRVCWRRTIETGQSPASGHNGYVF